MKSLAAILLLLVGCGPTVVDPDAVDPLFAVGAEYQDWYRVDTTEPVPGHGDTYRIIYANELAREESNTTYERGSIIVKEVHDRDGDQPGALRYIGVMRYMAQSEAPDGVELGRPTELPPLAGWLFTYLPESIESDEEYRSSCWDECHVAAPEGGAFLDFR
ncbi:MAG TPA: cytochrome P460 family protein [Kofleriaceae bacterium]|nr:cytochrome P460 family protein [Kofleriaceae bacterium]